MTNREIKENVKNDHPMQRGFERGGGKADKMFLAGGVDHFLQTKAACSPKMLPGGEDATACQIFFILFIRGLVLKMQIEMRNIVWKIQKINFIFLLSKKENI